MLEAYIGFQNVICNLTGIKTMITYVTKLICDLNFVTYATTKFIIPLLLLLGR